MAKKSYKHYMTFLGMNSASAPDNLKDEECRLLQNVDLSERGGLVMRPGIKAYKTLDAVVAVDKIIEFLKSDGTMQIIYAYNRKLARDDGTVLNANIRTDTLDYVNYKGKMYFVNGEGFWEYDGTTFAAVVAKAGPTDVDITVPQKCKYITLRNERLLFAGHVSNPSHLYYTELTEPNYPKSTNYIYISGGEADTITGLSVFKDRLMVHKTRGLFTVDWTILNEDLTVKQVDLHTGTMAASSIVRGRAKDYFIAKDGVYNLYYPQLVDQISAKKISTNIGKTFEGMVKQAVKFFSAFYRDKVILFMDYGAGKSTEALVYHINAEEVGGQFIEPWSVYTGLNASCCRVLNTGELVMGTKDGKIVKFDETTYNDLGQRIPVRIETRIYDLGTPFHTKKIKRFFLACQQNEALATGFTITVDVDACRVTRKTDLDLSMVYGEGMWGYSQWGWTDVVSTMVPVNLKGKRTKVTIENTLVDQPLTFYGAMFEYKEKGPDKTQGLKEV